MLALFNYELQKCFDAVCLWTLCESCRTVLACFCMTRRCRIPWLEPIGFPNWNPLRHPTGLRCFQRRRSIHTEKSFQNLIKLNWNQIVFTIFRLIWNQMNDRLVPNHSENGSYNLILVWFKKISLCVGQYCILPAIVIVNDLNFSTVLRRKGNTSK